MPGAWADSDVSMLFQALVGIRKLLNATMYRWDDGDSPPTNLLSARIRAKYYGGMYIILRPYVFTALKWQDQGVIKLPVDLNDWLARDQADIMSPEQMEEINLPRTEILAQDVQRDHHIAEIFLWCCKRCIDAAVYSTIAFDGIANPDTDRRMRVTNIHGTATA